MWNLCTARYVPYWPPTHELPLQIPMAQRAQVAVEVHRLTSSMPNPVCPMYMYVPNRSFAVHHINNIVSNKRTFSAILEYSLWSVSPLSTYIK